MTTTERNFDPDLVESWEHDQLPDAVRRMDHADVKWLMANLTPRSTNPVIAKRWREIEATEESAELAYETLQWAGIRLRERIATLPRDTDEEESRYRRSQSYLARLDAARGHIRRVMKQHRRDAQQSVAQQKAEDRRNREVAAANGDPIPVAPRRPTKAALARARYASGNYTPKDLLFNTMFGRLINAVQDHRQAAEDDEIEAEPHDLALWAFADDLHRASIEAAKPEGERT